jgi:AcrR family transcriptional regulator
MTDRKSRKKEVTARRREQILKAATEVFIRKGFGAATIPEIARTAGLAAGTIYLYFPSSPLPCSTSLIKFQRQILP